MICKKCSKRPCSCNKTNLPISRKVEITIPIGVDSRGAVYSVNDKTGEVRLNTDDIPEGSLNKYNVQSDWDSDSGLSEVLNKPTKLSDFTNDLPPVVYPVTTVNGKTGDVVITKTDVGLSNVDNTSDLSKPISTATQIALSSKEQNIPTGTISQYYRGDKTWQELNKATIGLDKVDNTSDAEKPVSTATMVALTWKEDKANKSTTLASPDDVKYPTTKAVSDGLSLKVDKVAGKQLSDENYTLTEKNKLSGIETGAQKNVKSNWLSSNGDSEILNKPTKLSDFTNDLPPVVYPVTSVNSRTGDVVITKADVGLENVLNVKQATKTEFDAFVTNNNNALATKVDKSTTITGSGGITVGGSLDTGAVSVGVNDIWFNSRYLRKDSSDNNGTNTLTLGKLETPLADIVELQLKTLASGTDTDNLLVVDSTGVVKKKPATVNVDIGISNETGVEQFSVGANDDIRFAGSGDTSISFNPSNKTITITSIAGSGTGGAVTSFNGRTGGVVSVSGDYSTSQVTESPSNLYFTEPRVLGSTLTGLSLSNTPVVASDSLLQSVGKLQGQLNTKAKNSTNLTVSGASGRIIVGGGAQNISEDREWTVDLVPTGVISGTYTKVTVDGYGRVSSGSQIDIDDVAGLSGLLDTKANKDGTNVSLPTESQHLVNLQYLQGNYLNSTTTQSKIDERAFTNGSNATGHWGISVNNANTWNTYPIQWDGANTSPADIIAWDNSRNVFSPISLPQLKTALNVSTTPEPNTIVQRDANGYLNGNFINLPQTKTSQIGSVMTGVLGFDSETSFVYNFTKQALNTFLGNSEGGANLQSVLDNGNSAENSLSLSNSVADTRIVLSPNLTTGGAAIQGYNSGAASPRNLLIQPAGGNIGVGVTNPKAKLDVGGYSYSDRFGVKYVDGDSYSGLKNSPDNLGLQLYANITTDSTVKHFQFTNGSKELASIKGDGSLHTKKGISTFDQWFQPVAGVYHTGTTDERWVKIRLPQKVSSNDMISFKVRLYQGYMSTDLFVSGYLYDSAPYDNWYEPYVEQVGGKYPITVVLGKDEDQTPYISIQGSTYSSVAVIDVLHGYTSVEIPTKEWEFSRVDKTIEDLPNRVFDEVVYPKAASNKVLFGASSSSTPETWDKLAIGSNASSAFVQSHNGVPLELNPEGNVVRISNQDVTAGDIINWKATSNTISSKANTDGSNTTGGLWWINSIYSNLITTSNKQVFATGPDAVYAGNKSINLILESADNNVKLNSAYNLYHTGNLDISQYALRDGSNATGTWPISITGNATSWSGQGYAGDDAPVNGYILGLGYDNKWRPIGIGNFKNWLGINGGDFIDTTSNQTGLTGNKTSNGTWTFGVTKLQKGPNTWSNLISGDENDLVWMSDVSGAPSQSMRLTVGGDLHLSGDVEAFSTSDIALKDNVKKLEYSLDKINSVSGYEYDWNSKSNKEGHDVGVIAQEIEKIIPEAVTTRENGYKAVKYEKIIPLLIESIKELTKKVEDLENGISK